MPVGFAPYVPDADPTSDTPGTGGSDEGLIVIDTVDDETSRIDPGQWGVTVLTCWIRLVRFVVLGFAFSFFWTSTSAVYLLLRHDVDATELDEIYLEEEDDTTALPPLKKDDAGAPVVDDGPAPDDQADASRDGGNHDDTVQHKDGG